ncbi:MAG: 50S ribosomal protein L3 N(5)-glutamine methyltransferase [Hyphomicrobium sp.]
MSASPPDTATDDLHTIRDWWRYGISRFNAAGLAYGHGTEDAAGEAAFLILRSLHLPPDALDPWLDARLTRTERAAVHDLIERRIATRKPAAYLLGEAWIGDLRFVVDERVIVPRSFIGELLRDGLDTVLPDPLAIRTALDLCTGSGCLAILAAVAFPGAAVDAADLSADALDVARRNVGESGLEARVRLIESDLFAAMPGRRYDLIVSNPPYVSRAAMVAFPPEHRAEPVMAHDGGADGLDLVRRILADAPSHLAPDGVLVVEIGTGRPIIEREYPELDFLWLDTETSAGEVFALPASAFEPMDRKARKKRK